MTDQARGHSRTDSEDNANVPLCRHAPAQKEGRPKEEKHSSRGEAPSGGTRGVSPDHWEIDWAINGFALDLRDLHKKIDRGRQSSRPGGANDPAPESGL